ncbi:MAG: hypothetical protein ACW986_20190, partial [Promethearchaeota archaeon]
MPTARLKLLSRLILLFILLGLPVFGLNSLFRTGRTEEPLIIEYHESYEDTEWLPIRNTLKYFNTSRNSPVNQSIYTVEYDAQLKTEKIGEIAPVALKESFQRQTSPYLGKLEEKTEESDNILPILSYVFPPDDRVRVATTSNYPWITICKLYVTAADDTHWIGSGT